MSRAIKLTFTWTRERVDENGRVEADEVHEEQLVHPGHYLHRLFSKPGVRAFRPSATPQLRITVAEDQS